MSNDPLVWEERQMDFGENGLHAESGTFSVNLDPWLGEDVWQLYMEVEVSSAEEGKRLAEHVLAAINAFK